MINKFYSQLYQYFQTLTPEDIRISNCAFYTGNTNNAERHSHSTLELDYFLKGQHSIYTNANPVPLVSHAYNLVGYMPDCQHQGNLLGSQETIILWFDIPPCPPNLSSYFYLGDKSGVLRFLFEQIYAEYRAGQQESSALIQHYAFCIVKLIMRQFRQPSDNGIRNDVFELLQYIESNYNSEITPEQMASKLNISEPHLYKVFREVVGITPLQYIQNIRIEQAKNLLSASRYSVQDVADIVGYSDARYFTRIFKKIVGLSPRDWKKQSKLQ